MGESRIQASDISAEPRVDDLLVDGGVDALSVNTPNCLLARAERLISTTSQDASEPLDKRLRI
jgi:hypothetical protein